MPRIRKLPILLYGPLLGALLWAASAAASITGVCPDGSIFVVAREALIPCKAAKQVAPEDVPPLRPEYLPRPYTWQVYSENNNPNNAYNLIDSARQVRALRDAQRLEAAPEDAPGNVGAGPAEAASAREAGPLDLGLSDGEMRDLFFIVEYAQEGAPASFAKQTAAGDDVLLVSLAHSPAFEDRFAEAWRERGRPLGPVLLFTAVARAADAFYANLTFSQGRLAFQPRADDPLQFGVLQGRLGPLDPDAVVLGYVVLPDRMDLSAPMDVYWDDRRLSVTLAP